jgi:hypothetical protein
LSVTIRLVLASTKWASSVGLARAFTSTRSPPEHLRERGEVGGGGDHVELLLRASGGRRSGGEQECERGDTVLFIFGFPFI